MYSTLETYIEELKSSFADISTARKETLTQTAKYIRTKLEAGETAKLNFICTHNSRRSHFAQIWTGLAAYYYKVSNIETYSGGTEATAFNPAAVQALERAGFKVEKQEEANPRYRLFFDDEHAPMICFSKTYSDPVNPSTGFAAIMTCSDADANCPFVPGAEFRIPITYADPKEADGTPDEKAVYDKRCRQIAAEMFYMISNVG